ncbi:MAG: FAD-dependent monooxygenase [Burkholderiaceae bacterium]|nr:FAD-dependent monooxygenase [Burkholderiaceae bacterium]MDO9089035.1 FAD-dependent monooxygenase [Burkholderiaceae bacterium]
MTQPLDVCIRGAGIVGRTLALLLAGEKLRVGLVAQPAMASHSDVRAYALNAASRGLLESLRVWPDEQHATPVRHMRIHGDAGGAVSFDAQAHGVQALAWIVDVPALEARLTDAVRYQPLIEVLDRPQAAALTVICEGKSSATRAEFATGYELLPYGQQAIACRLDCEIPHQQTAWQWFADGQILAFLPLSGPQGNSVAVVWSVQEDRAAALLALAEAEFAQALENASGGALGHLTLQGPRLAWPLQMARAQRWTGVTAGQAWALAGDAAHAVHPLAGQGLNLGLADVAELAQVLREREAWRSPGDARLLRRYERARQSDVLALGTASDGLQRLFARGEAPWPSLRNWGMKGFERSNALKNWVARRAMGLADGRKE